jgi:adenine C2-methylase RlmN of 23S rRNA A2503 and tRNA A37
LHSEEGTPVFMFCPLNPTKGGPIFQGKVFTRSEDGDMAEFVRRLEAKGIPTTVRDTRGNDIDAACGQLAALPDAL